MNKATDSATLRAARNGDEQALAAIIAKEMPVIRWFARRAVRPGLDFDDAVQEGLIGLFRAIEVFDTKKEASFSTYASVCIKNAVVSAGKSASRLKHSPLNHSVPIPEEQSIPGPEEQTIANEQVSLTLEKARTQLSPLEKNVLRYFLDGFSYQEIGEKLAITPKAVDNALVRLRRKLK